MSEDRYKALVEALPKGIRDGLEETRLWDLSASAYFMNESEERMIQLANQGRVEAIEEADGWVFDSLSLATLATERLHSQLKTVLGTRLPAVLGEGEGASEELISLIETIARHQYSRGRMVGWQQEGEFIANLIDEKVTETRAEDQG